MNQNLKERWVEALRSGDYGQGKFYLKQTTSTGEKFCCIGVLCNLVDKEKWHPIIDTGDVDGWGEDSSTFTAGNGCGLKDDEIGVLVRLNDSVNANFGDIAAVVETFL